MGPALSSSLRSPLCYTTGSRGGGRGRPTYRKPLVQRLEEVVRHGALDPYDTLAVLVQHAHQERPPLHLVKHVDHVGHTVQQVGAVGLVWHMHKHVLGGAQLCQGAM